ncbi:MAG TPA: CAP domain-containing protein [Actinomycetota bacterium]|nr:CAP domain-containing protein [Actinomycetota bacterium]
MPVGAAHLGWRRVRWIALALALALMLPEAILSLPAHAQTSGDAPALLAMINQDRASAGESPVSLNGTLTAIAQGWAGAMAAAQRISQNPAFPGDVLAANAAGENVGVGPTASAVHDAFVASPPHQAVMTDSSYRIVGIATAPSPVGLMVVEDFADTVGSASLPLPAPATHAAPPPAAQTAPAKPKTSTPGPASAPPAARQAVAQALPATVQAAAPPPAPSPRPAPTIDVALYSRMLQWEQWQAVSGLGS